MIYLKVGPASTMNWPIAAAARRLLLMSNLAKEAVSAGTHEAVSRPGCTILSAEVEQRRIDGRFAHLHDQAGYDCGIRRWERRRTRGYGYRRNHDDGGDDRRRLGSGDHQRERILDEIGADIAGGGDAKQQVHVAGDIDLDEVLQPDGNPSEHAGNEADHEAQEEIGGTEGRLRAGRAGIERLGVLETYGCPNALAENAHQAAEQERCKNLSAGQKAVRSIGGGWANNDLAG